MQNPKLMRIFVESLNAFMSESVVRNVKLVEVKVAAVEHLFEPIVSDMVVDDIERLESLGEVFGDVEQTLITDFAAIELEVFQVGVALEKLIKQVFV